MEYACPRCGRKLFIVDTNQGGFNYKASCFGCSFYTYYEALDKLQEFKEVPVDKRAKSTKSKRGGAGGTVPS